MTSKLQKLLREWRREAKRRRAIVEEYKNNFSAVAFVAGQKARLDIIDTHIAQLEAILK